MVGARCPANEFLPEDIYRARGKVSGWAGVDSGMLEATYSRFPLSGEGACVITGASIACSETACDPRCAVPGPSMLAAPIQTRGRAPQAVALDTMPSVPQHRPGCCDRFLEKRRHTSAVGVGAPTVENPTRGIHRTSPRSACPPAKSRPCRPIVPSIRSCFIPRSDPPPHPVAFTALRSSSAARDSSTLPQAPRHPPVKSLQTSP
jgi:hypothetical protein